MKFGVREICDVVFRAKTKMQFGNKTYYKGEPVIYFDSLKTTSLEGAVTTVYANGGKGNARLMSWDGEKTVTFTMEDALISPVSLSMLTNSNVVEASENKKIKVHTTQRAKAQYTSNGSGADTLTFKLEKTLKPLTTGETAPFQAIDFYAMLLNSRGEIISEPYVKGITIAEAEGESNAFNVTITLTGSTDGNSKIDSTALNRIKNSDGTITVLADYYVERDANVMQIDITPEQHGGNYYIEASTLFRNTDGEDLPAEFIIPNARVQSNFTFSMASTGDPSTFSFVMDAFPDYTRHDPTQEVFASIQIIEEEDNATSDETRAKTIYPSTSNPRDTDTGYVAPTAD